MASFPILSGHYHFSEKLGTRFVSEQLFPSICDELDLIFEELVRPHAASKGICFRVTTGARPIPPDQIYGLHSKSPYVA